jgi:pimeloyl-ACP methyl ester carboxylesterase
MKKTKNILRTAVALGMLTVQSNSIQAQSGTMIKPSSKEAIRPFKVHVPDEMLDDLRKRVLATKWPQKENVLDASQGVQLATLKKLANYWAIDYDWRKVEARLNALPQFTTTIDDVDIHFIHVRSKHKNALPLLITHGWPGSIIEMLKIIDPLTDPTNHGGKAEDAFDVIIPSIPGYGFSGQPTTIGWGPSRIATAWIQLMDRLGYKKFVAQGGDWGTPITEQMAIQAPDKVLAMHTNMPFAMPDEIAKALKFGESQPPGLSADEKNAYDQLVFFFTHGLAYAQEMGNRPQTMYAIDDSPIGLAAWLLDHDARSYAMISRAIDGQNEGLTKDDVLDNITLYWVTNTGVSSSRLYWENKLPFFVPLGVKVPVAVSAFPDELYQAPESWAKRAYPKLIYYNKLNKGGHFAAWEQPRLFTQELRAAFRSLR